MKNIYFNSIENLNLEILKNNEEIICFDIKNDIIILFTNLGNIIKIENNEVNSFDLSNDILDKVIKIIFKNFKDQLILITDNGKIFYFNFEDNYCDLFGQQEDGILYFSLSPNEELFLMVTNINTILLFDEEFDVIKEFNFEEIISEKVINAEVSWKYDSEFFSIIYGTVNGKRADTFDNNLNIYRSVSKSDPKGGLVQTMFEYDRKNIENLVYYLKNGSLIVSVEKIENNYELIFWEKNGLWRFNKKIKENIQNITDISGDNFTKYLILKVLRNDKYFLDIYCKSNSIWFHKTSVLLNPKNLGFYIQNDNLFLFNPNEILKISLNLKYSIFKKNNDNIILFNHCNILKATYLNKCLMPPPMSQFEYELEKPIKRVFFKNNYIYILDIEFNLIILDFNENNFKLVEKIENNNSSISDIVVDNNNNIYFLTNNGYLKNDKQIELSNPKFFFEDNKNQIYLLANKKIINLNNNNEIDIEENIDLILDIFIIDEKIFIFNKKGDLFLNNKKIMNNVSSLIFNQDNIILSIDTNEMYDHLIFKNINQIENIMYEYEDWLKNKNYKNYNFREIEKYAILITSFNQKIIFQMKRGNLEAINHRILSIKEGYNLLNEKKIRDLFILFRKNRIDLNLIIDLNPKKIIELINDGTFFKELNKKEHLDLFITNIKNEISEDIKFILDENQIKEDNIFFLNTLKNESKINYFCKLILEQLRKNNLNLYYTEMALYSTMNPPDYKNALKTIKDLKNETKELENDFKPPHLTQKNDIEFKKVKNNYKEVLKYLCWLSDSQILYKFSMLSYDLDLALMVAEFTNLDPKEYLPYIEKLRNIKHENDLKLQICKDFRDYKLYVKESCKILNEEDNKIIEDELFEILKDKKLHFLAIMEWTKKNDFLKKIKESFSEELVKKKDYKQALNYYLMSENYEKSIFCCEKIMDLKTANNIFKYKLKDEIKMKAYFNNLYNQFYKAKAFNMCIKIKKNLNQEKEDDYYILLVKDKKYNKIKNYFIEINENEELKNKIRIEIKILGNVEYNDFEERKNSMVDKINRLKIIQEEKVKFLKFKEINKDEDNVIETMSEMSYSKGTLSNVSLVSGASVIMGKKQRKPENLLKRKCKEGSIFEEDYIVDYLNSIKIEETHEKELYHLIDCLLLFDEYELAKNIVSKSLEFKNILLKNFLYKTVAQKEFEKEHQEVYDLYSHLKEFKIVEVNKSKIDKNKKNFMEKYLYLIN